MNSRLILLRRSVCVVLLVSLLLPLVATAHEVRPVYLGIAEVGEDVFDISWKQGQRDNTSLSLRLILPTSCRDSSPVVTEIGGGAFYRRWQVQCARHAFREQPIFIDGLSASLTDVWIDVRRLNDNDDVTRLATPSTPNVWIAPRRNNGQTAYLALGMRHLVFGVDHALLIIGFLLLVRGLPALLKTITAFTVAHSLSLAAAALNIVSLSPRAVEAAIALSVLYLAVEASKSSGTESVAARASVVTVFCFGLLHGLGFAGALAEIGLPSGQVIWALFLFNLGIEIGQLLVIAVVLTVVQVLSRVNAGLIPQIRPLPVYTIGIVASFLLWRQLSLILGFDAGSGAG